MNSLLIIWDVRSFIFKMATLTLNLYLTTIEQKCRLQDYRTGDSDVVIISDIFDSKTRLVCRTKFIVYVNIGEYEF